MIKSGIGTSSDTDAFKAGQEAARTAIENMGDDNPNVIIVFASISFDQNKVLEGINAASPGTSVVGGTSGWGTITNEGPADKEVAVNALKFEKTKVAVVSAEGMLKNPLGVGSELGEKLLKEGGEPPKLAFLFHATPLVINMDLLAQGFKEKIGEDCTVVGGGLGDDMQLKDTGFQYHDTRVLRDSAVVLGLWGDFSFSVMAEHGWEAIGLPEVVKAKGNIVSEIGGKPAASLYEKYFDKSVEELRKENLIKLGYGYPLGIIPDKEGEEIIVRQVVNITEDGSIILVSSIPDGSKVCIMYADAERMPQIARDVAKSALSGLGDKNPQAAFVWDCVCRKTLMIPDQKKEIAAISEVIGKEVPLFGFYTYGEWAASKKGRWTSLNETLVLTLLSE